MVFPYLAWLFVPVLSEFLCGTCALEFKHLSEFRILFLDKRNQIIADEVQQKGTIDHTPVYLREVVKPAGNGDRAGAQSPLRRPYFLPC